MLPARPSLPPIPAALFRFDRWTAMVPIASDAVELGHQSGHLCAPKRSVEATINFGEPPASEIPGPKDARVEKPK